MESAVLYRIDYCRNVVLSLTGGCVFCDFVLTASFKKKKKQNMNKPTTIDKKSLNAFLSGLCEHASKFASFRFSFYSEMKFVQKSVVFSFS